MGSWIETGVVTPPSRISITRRIRALGQVANAHDCGASTLVGTVLRMWCEVAFPALPNPKLPYSKSLATEPEVIAFVELLKRLGFLEATYWLSSTYAMQAEESYRKELAMFFTPVSLTNGLLDDLVDQGVDFGTQSFLDPACGGAAFLAPIALRIKTALLASKLAPQQILRHVETHLYGTDLDAVLCELSKHFLGMALHEEIKASGYLPSFKVYKADSLTELAAKYGSVDVVICNPPYRKMKAQELAPLRASYSEVIEAQPNLYGLFIALCVRLLRVNGYAALVTPTSFLSGQYFSRLRKFLMHHADIEHIGMVSDRQGIFIDVEQETALTVLRRRSEEVQARLRSNVSVVSAAGQYKNVGECFLANTGAVWPIPRSDDDVDLLKIATRSKFRLSDYGYRVRIGAYVWNRDKRKKIESLKDTHKGKIHTAVPLIWSKDISAGDVVQLKNEKPINGKHRFVEVGDKPCSSVITAPSVVMQRVTSSDQPRRLIAAEVSLSVVEEYGGFIGENHVVILEQVTEGPALTPSMLVRLLGAYSVDRYFRCISGATNVSAFELNQMALPDPQALKQAMAGGGSMDDAVELAFGLSVRE